MTKPKYTTETFIDEVESIYPNEFTILGEYKDRRTKILIRHEVCGDEYDIYPYDFLKQRYAKCKKCNSKEKAIEGFNKYLKDNGLDNEYTYEMGNAIYQKDNITITHLTCNHSHVRSMHRFMNSEGCPFCNGSITNSSYVQYRINKLHGEGNYIVLNDDVTSINSKLSILHSECGQVTNTKVNYIVNQHGKCSYCTKENYTKLKMKSQDQFEKEVDENFNGAYSVIGKYTGATNNVKIKHNACGNELEFLGGRISTGLFGCKFCNMSTPESIIYYHLKNRNVKNLFQYKFDDCVGEKAPLPFDFAILDDSDNLVCIIEYDGQGHFSEKSFGKESFERIKKNDSIKNTYCESNNIKLHRIHFKEYKRLNDVVDEILKQYGII